MKTLECLLSFKPGALITGRWERNCYKVIRLLGRGGTGVVYLVKDENGELRAMKISSDLIGITREHRTLLFLNRGNRTVKLKAVPEVYELDDFQIGSTVYHYIVLDYCPGVSLGKYKGRLTARQVAMIGQQAARFLDCLHRAGLVFGDLKPGNVLYDFKNNIIYVIDYGSVCFKGQSLKQYTPDYDRASWQAGTRIADENYDTFTLGMFLTSLALGKVSGTGAGLAGLISIITRGIKHPLLREAVLKTLQQRPPRCREVAAELSIVLEEDEVKAGCEGIGGFVNFIGIASAVSFMLSLAYYYQ